MDTENNITYDFDILSPDLNMAPPDPGNIHLMGICGTGMASLAGILKQSGYTVTGSDENVYPPMSIFLENLSIPVKRGYCPENLDPRPDLVIVGNVITKKNPEALHLSRLKIPYLSMPQALRHFAMKDKKSIVISGTHGKTTTSSVISWIIEESGMDPGFMIGGILKNFQRNYKLGKGPYFIIEGDEYDTAFFDKGSKFLHYAPWITVITSIEFDHADIFRNLDHIIESFRRLIELIPADGLLIANGDDPVVNIEARRAKCPVIFYGLKGDRTWKAVDITLNDRITHFKVLYNGKEYVTLHTLLYGNYNISNLLAGVALSEHLGIDRPSLTGAVSEFKGVKRRQEEKGERRGILVLDDFAHHPTAVKETILGVKKRYAGRRIIAVFEPRSNSSRRNIFQEQYGTAFDSADLVFIPEPPMMDRIPPEERFSSIGLVETLTKKGLNAFYSKDSTTLLDSIVARARKGDVILIMSNGSFDNIHEKLLDIL